ncbi:hypothetical protein C2134_00570 [Chromobacterium sinusclupearum]|uniref:Uncharacterized protein n=1 Tax=Chromobacterium sinusclupearum TaxID=2077146 RepID=A0A2K4MUV0_9NEIS|nr:hypothetical protein [Chromobacterium sinusclupearum]POB00596.1 hypothetical protein C2134_00570 [Chromobacterium sinusclupearum]
MPTATISPGIRLPNIPACAERHAAHGVGAVLRGAFGAPLRRPAAAPASLGLAPARSAAPLQDVLASYHQGHPGRLLRDLAQRPALGAYLQKHGGGLAFKAESLTPLQFKTLLAELKKAGHGLGSRLPGQLRQAWQSAAPLILEEPAGSAAQASDTQPAAQDGNPFGIQDAAPVSASHLHRGDDIAQNAMPAYPEWLNPFAIEVGKVSAAPCVAEAAETGLSAVLLQLLNRYLYTRDGYSFGKVNGRHVDKLRQNIESSPAIARHLVLSGDKGQEAVTWRTEPSTRDELQQLLQALQACHAAGGSLSRLLAQVAFVDAGYRLLDDATHDAIVHQAARPAAHRPGKADVVEMKRQVMQDVLQHFSDPRRHAQPLPGAELAPLIAHYGRVEQDQARALQVVRQLENKHAPSLDDHGLFDALQRFFHRIKTEERVERFEDSVGMAAGNFHKKMVEELARVRERHAPEQVAERAKIALDQHLEAAHARYARHAAGKNIYPQRLDRTSPVAGQIDAEAHRNYRQVTQGIVSQYENGFMRILHRAVASFSAAEFLKGKSRERVVRNAIKLNDGLCELYLVAERQHLANRKVLQELSLGYVESGELDAAFQEQLKQLVTVLRSKFLLNYQDALHRYVADIDKIKPARPGKFSAELKLVRELANISGELTADVERIRSERLPKWLSLDGDALPQEVKKATTPILTALRQRLPKAKTVGQTLRSAFARAFKPTPARILGGLPLIGGLAFSLAALPTAVAVPLGIAAAVTLPVALLGWVGWNIYKRFDERSELNQLRKQMEQQWKAIETPLP